MWVELRTIKMIERNGRLRAYKPGSRVDIGRHDAMKWISAGDAVLVDSVSGCPTEDVGIIALGPTSLVQARMAAFGDEKIAILEGAPRLQWGRTLVWNPQAALRLDLLGVGFNLLARWQAAAPLWSYTELACHVGTDEDRERTKAVIRDLRAPLYDTRVLFLQRCKDTRALLDEYAKEREGGGDDRLAFLRAFYRVKPTLCALPASWTGRGA